jgi:hypothetical protein
MSEVIREIEFFFLHLNILKQIRCRRYQEKENEEIRLNSSDGKRVLSDHQSLKIRHNRTSEERTNTTDEEQIQENGENNDVHSTTVNISLYY